jgi:hypothetical protein
MAQADAASQNAGKLLIAILTVCAYAWLTIWSTTDAALFANTTPIKLPILNPDVLLASVYWVAPGRKTGQGRQRNLTQMIGRSMKRKGWMK